MVRSGHNEPAAERVSRGNGTSAEFVRMSGLQNLEKTLQSFGVDLEALSQQLGFEKSDFDRGDMIISVSASVALMEACIDTTGREDFFYHLIKTQGLGALGSMGLLLQTASNIKELLSDLEIFTKSYAPLAQWFIRPHGDLIAIQLVVNASNLTARQQRIVTEFGPCKLFHLLQIMTNSQFKCESISFIHSDATTRQAAEQFFQAPVDFNADMNALWIRPKTLKVPIVFSNKDMHALMREKLSDPSTLELESSLANQIRIIISSLLPSGTPTVEEVARYFHCDKRTLQRHLRREHDLSFQDLLSAVRLEKAQHYLRTANMSMTQIAYLLGYSDPSNFSRAFRALVGCSVREWVAANEPHRRRSSLARRRSVV